MENFRKECKCNFKIFQKKYNFTFMEKDKGNCPKETFMSWHVKYKLKRKQNHLEKYKFYDKIKIIDLKNCNKWVS